MLTFQLSLLDVSVFTCLNLQSENFTFVRVRHTALALNYNISRHTEYIHQIYIIYKKEKSLKMKRDVVMVKSTQTRKDKSDGKYA